MRLWRIRWLTMLGLLAAALAVGLCSLRLAAGSYGEAMFQSYFARPATVWLNLAPPVLLIFFLWFLLRRAWLAVLLGGGLVTLLSVADHFKLLFRDDPLTAADLGLAAEGINMAGHYLTAISGEVILAIAAAAAAVLLMAAICRARPAWASAAACTARARTPTPRPACCGWSSASAPRPLTARRTTIHAW